MSQRSVCPHCSFRNFSVSDYCARCEKPLRDGAPPLADVSLTADHTQTQATAPPVSRAPARPMPPIVQRAWPSDSDLDASRRPTAPLTQVSAIPIAPRRPQAAANNSRTVPPPNRAPVQQAPSKAAYVDPTPTQAFADWGSPAAGEDVHEMRTLVGLPPERPQAPAPAVQQGPPPAARPPETATIGRRAAASAAKAAPGAQAGTHGAQSAQLWRSAVACCVDAALLLAFALGYAALEMLLKRGHWPSDRASVFEAWAMWLHVYANTARRVLLFVTLFGLGHAALGVRHGQTLGRKLLGLTLLDQNGSKGSSWSAALWHAVGSMLSWLALGAGHFWMLLDRRQRTWGNILSKTLVVRN